VHEQEQKRGLDALQLALHGGDDYELLFAVSQRNASRVPASLAGLRITPIGKIVKARQVHLLDRAGRTSVLHAAGWDPFRRV
jgi:thiamine-monophosphate kinase